MTKLLDKFDSGYIPDLLGYVVLGACGMSAILVGKYFWDRNGYGYGGPGGPGDADEDQITALERKTRAVENQVVALQRKNRAIENQVTVLERQNNEVENKFAVLERQNNELQLQVNTLENNINNLEQNNLYTWINNEIGNIFAWIIEFCHAFKVNCILFGEALMEAPLSVGLPVLLVTILAILVLSKGISINLWYGPSSKS